AVEAACGLRRRGERVQGAGAGVALRGIRFNPGAHLAGLRERPVGERQLTRGVDETAVHDSRDVRGDGRGDGGQLDAELFETGCDAHCCSPSNWRAAWAAAASPAL